MKAVKFPLLGLMLIALALLSLALGAVSIPLGEVAAILAGKGSDHPQWLFIVKAVRLPRVATAILAGSGLAVSGLLMQTLFRNPLAGPHVLGIHSGASLGVALVLLGGGAAGFLPAQLAPLTATGVVGAAIGGAAAVMGVVLLISRRVSHNLTLLIVGLMLGYATGALVTVLLYFSSAEQVRSFTLWSFGTFGNTGLSQLKVLGPVVLAGLLLAGTLVKPLNAALLGETYARSLGDRVGRSRVLIITCTSILCGGITAFCGPVAFIGLAVPHLCRGYFKTSDHRILMPAVILTGASLALAADLLSRLPGGGGMPLNAITAFLGAPVVIWIIIKGSHLKAVN